MMGYWFLMTQFLQNVLGFSPFEAGLAFLPMTILNFIVAILVPRLTRRFGNANLLAVGLVVTLIGMFWLSHLSAESNYLTGVALPMFLIGMGQGATLSPITVSGVASVRPEDTGAASGLVNVSHQLGGSLGLGILVVVFASIGVGNLDAADVLAHRISVALTGGCVMLTLALLLVITLIVRPFSKRPIATAERAT